MIDFDLLIYVIGASLDRKTRRLIPFITPRPQFPLGFGLGRVRLITMTDVFLSLVHV
jgi:hypothetical protein